MESSFRYKSYFILEEQQTSWKFNIRPMQKVKGSFYMFIDNNVN